MLVLTQRDNDSILIGDGQTVLVALTPQDRRALEACSDRWLLDLARRLLAAPLGPIRVLTIRTRGDQARLGIDAPPRGAGASRRDLRTHPVRDPGRRES